ncbi:Endoplasmin [Hordeum vulgare]|nr:Endoplasmin [Hordeum vulgare]
MPWNSPCLSKPPALTDAAGWACPDCGGEGASHSSAPAPAPTMAPGGAGGGSGLLAAIREIKADATFSDGGRDLSGNKRTNKEQSSNHKFDKMNDALRLSCQKGYPIRVVRYVLLYHKIFSKHLINAGKSWNEFGKSVKLGIIEDATNINRLAKLLRFESSKSDGKLVSLDEYISRMKSGQKDIFYLTISSKEQLEKSPFLEQLKNKNYEGHENASAENGPWMITLDAPSYMAVMQHPKNKPLHEEVYRAYLTRASIGDLDNTDNTESLLY